MGKEGGHKLSSRERRHGFVQPTKSDDYSSKRENDDNKGF